MQGLEELEFPGSNQTYPFGINNAAEVVGLFSEPNGTTFHAFTWIPAAKKN
jgi:probable HAF family extracellular repeat protein